MEECLRAIQARLADGNGRERGVVPGATVTVKTPLGETVSTVKSLSNGMYLAAIWMAGSIR